MKLKVCTNISAVVMFAALTIPIALLAQEQQELPRYILKDLGTLGGPASAFNIGFALLNSHGVAVGAAETADHDPLNSNGFPCGPGSFVYHAFEWRDGILTDLGALPGPSKCSNAASINQRGEIAGNSENDEIDPLLGVFEIRAVVWKHRQIIDLGTLGGNASAANSINDRGQVVGAALNTIPDPFSFYYQLLGGLSTGTQTRAFLWRDGTMQDLGTLGGPDAQAGFVNDRGQVAGNSYTSFTPNPATGIPTVDPFLWDDGRMIDLGNFGGTSGGPNALNERGQVVGTMNLAGDVTVHPFLWNRGTLTDLGTFGGSSGQALWINDAGEVVGEADFPGDQVHDAFLWKHGTMTDLGNLGLTSFAYYINDRHQVVGHSKVNDGSFRAFLWENGGPMIDLNSMLPAGSSLRLTDAYNINDRGEIAGVGLPSGCANTDDCGHAYLLIPCDRDHADTEACADRGDDKAAVIYASPDAPTLATHAPSSRSDRAAAFHNRFSRSPHLTGPEANEPR